MIRSDIVFLPFLACQCDARRANRKGYAYYTHPDLYFKKNGSMEDFYSGPLDVWQAISLESQKYREPEIWQNCKLYLWKAGSLACQKAGKLVCCISTFRAYSALFAAQSGLQPAV